MGGQPSKERARRLPQNKCESEISCVLQAPPWLNEHNKGGAPRDSFSSGNVFVEHFLIALYDFNVSNVPEYQSQITVEKDDRLRFFGYSTDGDWVDVECVRTGERGWVPANYTAPICGSTNTLNPLVTSLTFQQQQIPFLTQHQSHTQQTLQTSSRGTSGHGSQASLAGVGLDAEKWYHGAIQRSYAEYLLNSGITGSFLVRESESKPGQLTISLRYEGRIYHYRINRDDGGLFYVTESTKFQNVIDLVRHHEKQADGLACTLLYPAAKRDKTTTKLRMSPEVDIWEIDRTEIIMKHKLGSGQYGVVYEALWKPYNILVAVKTLKEDVTVRDEFLEEARLMKTLRHPNLVELLGACTREPPYYIVTEFMCNGNLLDYLRTRSRDELTPHVLLYMATQIARAMAYLEQHNFIHRDLAARNCLVGSQHTIKVADFGLARCMERDLTYRAHEGAKFPIKWTAPEGLVYNLFSTKSDVWAFGVLLWEIATYGKTPYPGIELQDVYVFLERGTRMEQPQGCPEPIYKIMLQCWQWHPDQRPAFSQIRAQLEAMHTSASIEEQVAQELARVQLDGARSKKPSETEFQTKSNVPHPPLPPRPPPPHRSTSCDRILNETNPKRASPASDEGQLDSAMDETSFCGSKQAPVGVFRTPGMVTAPRRPRAPQYRKVIISEENEEEGERLNSTGYPDESESQLTFEDHCGSNSLGTTGSLGRKRAAPCPPRRTTPVKPFPNELTQQVFGAARLPVCSASTEGDPQGDDDVFPLPPPSDVDLCGGSSTGPRRAFSQAGCFASSTSPPPPPPVSSQSQGGFQMPSVMSTSAIFPSASTMESPTSLVKPARPAFLPNGSRAQTKPGCGSLKPIKSPGLIKLSSCDKSSPIDESVLMTGHTVGKPDGKLSCGSKVEATARLFSPNQSEHGPTRNPSLSAATNVDFRLELERRLQQQHQTQVHSYDRPNTPLKLTKSTKPSVTEPKSSQGSSPTNTITCGFLTIPRKKSAHLSSAAPIPTSVDRAVLRANPPSPSSPTHNPQTSSNAFFPLSAAQTHLRPLKGSTEQKQQQQQSQKQAQQPPSGLPKPSLRSPKRSTPWLNPQTTKTTAPNSSANRCPNKSNDQSTKRLSWTGPDRLHRPSEGSAMRPQRFCLPTILSNSSTGLDSVDVANQNQAPSSQVLIDRLMELVQRLETLRTDDPEPEQVIACAEQLEVCRLDCSAFIDQATCSARAKFAFRDRYASLQQLSANLRSNRSKQSPDPTKLISTVVNALQDILTELSKLTDSESNTTCAVDGHEDEDDAGEGKSVDGLRSPVSRPLRFAPVPTKLPQRVSE